jgi:glutathione S-transferase
MADVTIYGFAQSTYVRTCCMTCVEKGVGYERREARPHSPEILAYNPTGKMPGFQHGDLVLWETSAITRYLDEAFGGADLQPQDPVARARMNCWISMVNDVVYQTMIRDIVAPRFGFAEADEAKIKAATEKLERQLKLADDALHKSPYLAGEQLTLADLFLAPIIFWLEKTPEDRRRCPSIRRSAAGTRR